MSHNNTGSFPRIPARVWVALLLFAIFLYGLSDWGLPWVGIQYHKQSTKHVDQLSARLIVNNIYTNRSQIIESLPEEERSNARFIIDRLQAKSDVINEVDLNVLVSCNRDFLESIVQGEKDSQTSKARILVQQCNKIDMAIYK